MDEAAQALPMVMMMGRIRISRSDPRARKVRGEVVRGRRGLMGYTLG